MMMAKQLLFLSASVILSTFLTGCQNSQRPAGSLFGPSADSERWTIRCRRCEEPDHVQQAETLANMLRKVKQLDPKKVRVATDATGSTIYYGEYRRVASSNSGELAFPPEFQRDVELIRSLAYDSASVPPFFTAQPEAMDSGPVTGHPEWDARNAPSTHSLLVGVFYNTPTFSQRKEAAEQYVEILRKDGFPAYYYHEQVKSFVFVGDFTAADIVQTPEGPKPGPRVEQMIARREAEFRHFTENGFIRKHIEGAGHEVIPLTQVVRLPKKDSLSR